MNNVTCPKCKTTRNADNAPECPWCAREKEELPLDFQRKCLECTIVINTNIPNKVYCSNDCKTRKYKRNITL